MIKIRLMNLILCFFISCLLFHCTQRSKIIEINASFLEWELESPIRIDCNIFEEYGEFIKTRKFTNSEIKQIAKYIINLTPQDSSSHPDVRIKMEIIYRNNKSSILCIGNDKEILFNNIPVIFDNTLVTLVKEILY